MLTHVTYKFQRSADSKWGPKESNSTWDHDRYEIPPKSHTNLLHDATDQTRPSRVIDGESKSKSRDKNGHSLRSESFEEYSYERRKRSDLFLKNQERWGSEKPEERPRDEKRLEDDIGMQRREKHIGRRKSEPNQEDDPYRRGGDKRPRPERDSSPHYYRKEEEHHRRLYK